MYYLNLTLKCKVLSHDCALSSVVILSLEMVYAIWENFCKIYRHLSWF